MYFISLQQTTVPSLSLLVPAEQLDIQYKTFDTMRFFLLLSSFLCLTANMESHFKISFHNYASCFLIVVMSYEHCGVKQQEQLPENL